MEKFKRTIRSRIIGGAVLAVLSIPMFFLLSYFGYRMPKLDTYDFIRGFQVGILVGLEIVLIFFLGKFTAMLRSEEKLKIQYIKENDERNIMIASKSQVTAWPIETIALVIAVIVSGFFSSTVFFTLVAVLIAGIIIKLGITIYFKLKL